MNCMRLTAVATLLATTAFISPAAANTIGAVSALNQNVDGTPPQSDTRKLIIGDGLFSNELIESSPIGSGQFLFLDQTSLTIAKNSTLVLDKYVYDPATKTGEFSMTMTKGILRFVGGRITKNTDAVVVTPTATIGIRGGMAIIIVDEDGTTRVMHIAGEYTRVTRIGDDPSGLPGGSAGGNEIIISRGNGVAEVGPEGVTYIGVADQRLIREVTLELIGRGEAGEKRKPEDPDVAGSGVPGVNSEAKGAETRPPISTTGEKRESDVVDDDTTPLLRPNEEEIVGSIADDLLIDPNPLTFLPGVTGSASFAGSDVPGLTSGGGGQTFIFTQVFDGSRVGVTAAGETFIIPTEPGFFTFDFTEGASPNGGIAGGGFFDPTQEFTYAVFQTRGGQTGAFLAGEVSDPLAAAPDGQRTARRYALSPDLFTGGGAAFTPSSLGGFSEDGQGRLILLSNEGGAATGGSAKAVGTYLEINGTGANQTSGFGVLTSSVTDAGAGTPAIDGFFEGSFQDGDGALHRVETRVVTVEDGNGGSAFGQNARYLALGNGDGVGGGSTPGRVIDEAGGETLFGSNNVAERRSRQNILAQPASEGLRGFAATAGRDMSSGETYVGRSTTSNGVVLNVDPGANMASADLQLDEFISEFNGQGVSSPELNSLRVAYGGDDDRSAALDGDRFAMRQAAAGDFFANGLPGESVDDPQSGQSVFRGAMASADLAGDGGVFPAGVTAESEFLSWGWWAGEFRSDGSQTGLDGTPVDDQRLHLGAWVAGDIATSLPFSGVGTYDGFAVISAIQDGRNVVDGAGFGLVYDFGERAGTATFTDILGANATIGVTGESLSANYQGTAGIDINGSAGLITMNGSFFGAVTPKENIVSVETDIVIGTDVTVVTDIFAGTAPNATGGSLTFGTFDGRTTGAGVFAGDLNDFQDNRDRQ